MCTQNTKLPCVCVLDVEVLVISVLQNRANAIKLFGTEA